MKKLILLVLALSVLLTGCGLIGVSQDEYDDLMADYEDLKEEFAELEEQYDSLRESYERLAGISDGGTSMPADAPAADAPAEEPGSFAGDLASMLEVNEIKLETDWGDYYFLEITNYANCPVTVDAFVDFYDESGKVIAEDFNYIAVCDPGEISLLSFYSSEDFSWAEYELSVEEELYTRSHTGSLSWESETGTYGELVTIYNVSDETVDYVDVQMLFYDGDVLVEYSSSYAYDVVSGGYVELDMECFKQYDNYIIYYSGYSY